METALRSTPLPDLYVIEIKFFRDERGFFIENYHQRDFATAGLNVVFVQDNHSRSGAKVLRGLHYQDRTAPMGKLVRCIVGAIIDVVVDVRHGSPTLGHHLAVELTGTNHQVIWVPPGFAHGTFALIDDSIVLYECSSEHGPGREGGIRWNDPALAIAWPDITPIVSQKDREAPTLAEWLADPRSQAFAWAGC